MHWLYWKLCLGLSSESIHPRHCIVPAHWEERWWHLTAPIPSTPFILECCLLWQKEAKCMTQSLFSTKKILLLKMAQNKNCRFKVSEGKGEGNFFFFRCPQHGPVGSLLLAPHSVPPVSQREGTMVVQAWLLPRESNPKFCYLRWSDAESWELVAAALNTDKTVAAPDRGRKGTEIPCWKCSQPKESSRVFAWHRFGVINLEVEGIIV